MPTDQLIILCVAALAAIALVAYAHWRIHRDELEATETRAQHAAAEVTARRADEAAAALARAPVVGPPDGSSLVAHVDGRAVRGTRVRAGDPDTTGWIVLDDAVLLVGRDAQELGGRQWFREDRVTQLQEL